MKHKKTQVIISLCIVFLVLIQFSFFAQSNDKKEVMSGIDDHASHFVLQGVQAYEEKDWETAIHFFRRATSFPSTTTEELWYMLIMAEMYAERYEGAIQDGGEFKARYPDSFLNSYVDYQLGRAHYYVKHWDTAIEILSDFCADYPDHELYPSSLFWIAETLYAMHYYSLAASFYERIVEEYPKSVKMTEVLYRLDVINQREKEEKLLLLLQATSEEYLSSKEEYERQLRQFQTEESIDLRKQLTSAQGKIAQLESDWDEAQKHARLQAEEIAELQSLLEALEKEDAKRKEAEMRERVDFSEQIRKLKEKAAQVRSELEEIEPQEEGESKKNQN